MKIHLSLIFLLIICPCFSQTSERLENAKERLAQTQPFIPEAIDLNYNQRALLRKRHEEKIKAESTLLDRKYILEECYMTKLVDSIVQSLKATNSDIPQHTEAFIYKSTAFNAFTMGEDILFINASLVYECRNVHELATVIAHEIAHNSLKHSQQEQLRVIQFLTNDSIQKEIKNAAQQEYGQVTALNSLLLPKILNDKERSRENELDADSLGIKYIMAAGYDPIQGVKVFDIMKYYSDAPSGNMDYSKLPQSVRDIFTSKEKGYTRSNSLGFNQKVETEWDSYLRSHPYSKDRFSAIYSKFKLKDSLSAVKAYDSIAQQHLYLEMSNVAFELGALTRYQFIAVNNYSIVSEASRNMSFGFYALGFLKERFTSGKYLERQNVGQPENYDRLCYALNNCNSANFYGIGSAIKPTFNISDPTISREELLIGIIELVKQEDKETLELIWALHAQELRASEYGWFLYQIEDYLYTAKRYTFVKHVK